MLHEWTFFKMFSFTTLAAILLAGQNCLCNFEKGHYGEHLCEIILSLGHWIRCC